MKRNLSLLLISSFILLCFTSCKEEYSENYNPQSKLHKIWVKNTAGDCDYEYSYDDYDRVISVELPRENTFYSFEYKGDKKDLSVDRIAYVNKNTGKTEDINMTYNGADLLTQVTYSIDHAVRETINFTRNGNNKVTSITSEYDAAYFKEIATINNSKFYQTFIGENPILLNIEKSESEGMTLKSETLITWDALEENIIKTEVSIPDQLRTVVSEYTYVKSNNPFYGLPYAFIGTETYSLHNKSWEKVTTTINAATSVFETGYEYETNKDKYPTLIKVRHASQWDITTQTTITYLLK